MSPSVVFETSDGSLVIPTPPLDLISTPAFVAYSTRKLRAAYTGKAINVVRSSDNATADIGFTALGNLDIKSLLAFVGNGNSGFVTTWYDQSVNGINVTVPAGKQAPRIVNAGVLETTFEANPGLFFGIGMPTLSNNTCLTNPSAPSYTAADIYVVLSCNEPGPGCFGDENQIIFRPTDVSAENLAFDHSSSGYYPTFGLVTENQFTGFPTIGSTKATYSNATVQVYNQSQNGAQTSLQIGEPNPSGAGGGFTGQSPNAWICEFILTTSALSSGDRATLYANQKSYFRIDTSLLLDSYNYVTTAAYSLRKVRKAYRANKCINVRRDSDNATLDIGFRGIDLDTAALLSFVGAANGFVTTWYDQSILGYNLTQATAANQPQIVAGGSLITANGKPTIQFNSGVAGTINLSVTPGATRFEGGTLVVCKSATTSIPAGVDSPPVSWTTHLGTYLPVFMNNTPAQWGTNAFDIKQNNTTNLFVNTSLTFISMPSGTNGNNGLDITVTQMGTTVNIPGWAFVGTISEYIGLNQAAIPSTGDFTAIYNNIKGYWGTP